MQFFTQHVEGAYRTRIGLQRNGKIPWYAVHRALKIGDIRIIIGEDGTPLCHIAKRIPITRRDHDDTLLGVFQTEQGNYLIAKKYYYDEYGPYTQINVVDEQEALKVAGNPETL